MPSNGRCNKPFPTGTRFGKLVVVRELDPRRRADDLGTERLFLMRCDCGKESITRLKNLNAKTHPTRSCGCTGGRPRKVA